MTDVDLVVPEQVFSDLATLRHTVETAQWLRDTSRTLHWAVLRRIADCSSSTEPRAMYEQITDMYKIHGEIVAHVIFYPATIASGRDLLRMLRENDSPDAEATDLLISDYLSEILAACLVAAWHPDPDNDIATVAISLHSRAAGRFFLPGLGMLHDLPRDETFDLHLSGTSISIETLVHAEVIELDTPGPSWTPLPRVSVRAGGLILSVVLDNVSPYRMNSDRLLQDDTDIALQSWTEMLRQAWEVLCWAHPDAAAEVADLLTVIVPLRKDSDPAIHHSCSGADTFGAIASAYTDDPVTLAITLVHEIQHVKLYALLETIDLLDGDDRACYYAPWRDDPRPLSGLLQGVYAHIAIADMWRKLRREVELTDVVNPMEALRHYLYWREASDLVLSTLAKSGHLTQQGEVFVDLLCFPLRIMAQDVVPDYVLQEVRNALVEHSLNWSRPMQEIPAVVQDAIPPSMMQSVTFHGEDDDQARVTALHPVNEEQEQEEQE